MVVLAPRARVRNLFLRLLGAIFVVAFASLGLQARLLWGARGLLPACPVAATAGPTLFRFWCSDAALIGAAGAGAAIAVGLVLLVAPRWCLLACWGLYLSFVSIGGEFLSFQWDNLLLESAFFALFVAPGRLNGRIAPSPHPIAVFLMQWLLVRLMVESGAAKLLTGDPTWRDLTAMATYYETAPLPTWIGWWMHQLPPSVHRATSAATFVIELGLPLCIWGPRRLRRAAVAGMLAFQLFVILTANYGFFNYLSAILCLWALDDGDLGLGTGGARGGLARPSLPDNRSGPHEPAPAPGLGVRTPSPSSASWVGTGALAALALVVVTVSAVPFLPFLHPSRWVVEAVSPIDRVLDRWRSINAYHLFASMTLVRREPVIEGTTDGVTWQPYELRYKPGRVDRPPPFVAPYQPRVDFQLWFLLLGRRGAPYVETLLDRLLHDPDAVRPLFVDDPFPAEPPLAVRIAVYRYRFSDRATRGATGAWWTRELEGRTRPMGR